MTTTTSGELVNLAATIPIEEVPIKLRCPACNKLLLGAFRLPCCDQQICETCQASCPSSCPVCDHEPLKAEDCKPHKAQRLTVKAFLKNEEKKRGKAQQEEAVKSNPTNTPKAQEEVAKETSDGPTSMHTAGVDISHGIAQDPAVNGTPDHSVNPATIDMSSQQEVQEDGDLETAPSSPSSSVEFILDDPRDIPAPAFGRSLRAQNDTRPLSTIGHDATSANVANGSADAAADRDTTELGKKQNGMNGHKQNTTGGTGMNSSNGDWNNFASFNPMMAMQGGMNPAMWANFQQMMGMPGMMQNMGMDPTMMSQGMGGMNMNMMNMNMAGGFPAWNMGMGGEFGANSGFYPQSGYNQQSGHGHFNQMQRSQFNDNFNQNRFRGQGPRRGYGRDQQGFGGRSRSYGQQGFAGDSQPPTQRQQQQQPFIEGGEGARPAATLSSLAGIEQKPNGKEDETMAADILMDDRSGETGLPDSAGGVSTFASAPAVEHPSASAGRSDRDVGSVDASDAGFPTSNVAVTNVTDAEHVSRDHPASRGAGRGSYHGRGYSRPSGQDAHDFTPAPSVPEVKVPGVTGAPTGPKAMREGLPNVGLRGRGGFQIAGRGAPRALTPTATAPSVAPPRYASSTGNDIASNGQSQGSPAGPLQHSANGHSRSPSPSRSHRSRRHRSRSVISRNGDEDRDRHRERKHRHSRRHSRDRDRDREDSPTSTSGHRSRHDRNKDKYHSSRKERDRERSREHRRRQRSKSPVRNDDNMDLDADAHSSRRESKHREREHHRDGDRDDRRRSSRYDEGEDHHRHRSSRAEKRAVQERVPVVEKAAPREFKIKDSSKRKQLDETRAAEMKPPSTSRAAGKSTDLETQKQIVASENPSLDVYAVEREAQTRARLMKEEQRRQSIAGSGSATNGSGSRKRSSAAFELGSSNGLNGDATEFRSKKRSRHHDEGRSSKSRRTSYKYEDDEDSHARALRVESEREAARWG